MFGTLIGTFNPLHETVNNICDVERKTLLFIQNLRWYFVIIFEKRVNLQASIYTIFVSKPTLSLFSWKIIWKFSFLFLEIFCVKYFK